MTIKLNGMLVNPDLDIYKEVGCDAGYVETHTAMANFAGTIVAEFGGKTGEAMVSVIKLSRS